MNIHESQAKQLLRKSGVAVPQGGRAAASGDGDPGAARALERAHA